MVDSSTTRRIISNGNNDSLPFGLNSNSTNFLSSQLSLNKFVSDSESYDCVSNDPIRPTSSDRIKAYYQNVRGLRTKTSGFLLSSTSCDHDVIALTETSLHPHIFDGELFDTTKFLVHRCDRSTMNSDSDVLGGVLIAVRSHIKSELVNVPGIDEVEMVIVKLHFDRMNIFICCVYIPSGSPVATYQLVDDAFHKVLNHLDLNTNDELWVFGDFNLSNVNWIAQSDCTNPNGNMNDCFDDGNVLLPYDFGESLKADLLHTFMSADLHQINNVKNCNGRILDLVFTSNPFDVVVCKSPCPMTKIDPYHVPIEILIPVSYSDSMTRCNYNEEFNYAKADFIGLNEHLCSIDWGVELDCFDDVNEKVNAFYDNILAGLRAFVPYKRNVPIKHAPWYSKKVRSLKNQRNKAHKAFKSTGCRTDELKFFALRNEFESTQAIAFNRYLEKTQNDIASDPSKFWQYVKTRKNSTDYPSVMSSGESSSSDPETICSYFADFFESVYRADDVNVHDDSSGSDPIGNTSSVFLQCENILKSLESIDTSKGSGPDDISPLFLKECSDGLVTPLYNIFNKSLSSATFPNRWKTSYVKPIHKKGSRNVVTNYRGVAILPTFGKLFEFLICDSICERFSTSISMEQHGFFKGRSTSTNLLEFVSHAIKVIESGSQLDVIFTDFQKAFDSVSHSILIKKLFELGMDSNLVLWIKSYLSDRFQYVKLLGHESRKFAVKSGVPQGSHLGPLLFILFMDDVTRIFKSMKLLYADDLKLCGKVKSMADAIHLQEDLDALSNWCKCNRLDLNIGKCQVMSFFRVRSPIHFEYSIDGSSLSRVKCIQDLGVWLDEQLTFDRHIEFVTSKAYSMLGFVKRICKEFTNIQALKSVYFAHVRSYLEYASVVWHPFQLVHMNKIESIQKKFLIYALRRTVKRDVNYRLPSYLDRCASINIEPLWRRRINLNVLFVYDVLSCRIKSHVLSSLVRVKTPVRAFRNNEFLVVDFHRTDYGMHEPVNNIVRMFNYFSDLFAQSGSRSVFRTKVRSMSLPPSFVEHFGLTTFASSNDNG